jgi:fumarate hydratase class I
VRRGPRPICQDTGIVNVVHEDRHGRAASRAFRPGLEDAVNDGVRKGYLDPDNPLRASIVADPISSARTPATTRRR